MLDQGLPWLSLFESSESPGFIRGEYVNSDYFGRSQPEWNVGWGHFTGGEGATEQKAEFIWPLGDIITALAQAGLCIESLQEYPSHADWRFGEKLEEVRRMPGTMLLVAQRAG